MIRGGVMISGTMLLIGTLYATNASATAAGRWTIIALIYIFVVAFSMSWAVVNRIYCSEIQPMRTRAAATSLGQCANWVRIDHEFFAVHTLDHHTHDSRSVPIGRELGHRLLDPAVPLQVLLGPVLPLWRVRARHRARLRAFPA